MLQIPQHVLSQWEGGEKFFSWERESDPDIGLWGGCVLAREDAA